MMAVPLLDLRAQYRSIKPQIDQAVMEVLESGQFILGPAVERFETAFAAFCGTDHAIGVNSGTSALHLALLAAGVRPGDEVITVSMTFVATVAAILYTGARPVFVDVDPVTHLMDPDLIEAAITPRTKAILPVHLHGLMADMDAINRIAEAHGLMIIEDAAQAHGAELKGKRAGSLGRLGCFSFYPGKNLGAVGEGGAVVTNDPELAKTIRMLRDWGQAERYHHVLQGFNFRMEASQAAVLDVKLPHLEAWTVARRGHAALYSERLSTAGILLPVEPQGRRHVYHVYAARFADRENVRRKLAENGVATGIHYPVPVHLQPAYAGLGGRHGDFPVTERAAREFLSLPLFPEMSEEQVEAVVGAVHDALAPAHSDNSFEGRVPESAGAGI
jgi:dTDP-4-amino-4,6-dideoxygalactose transaminase